MDCAPGTDAKFSLFDASVFMSIWLRRSFSYGLKDATQRRCFGVVERGYRLPGHFLTVRLCDEVEQRVETARD